MKISQTRKLILVVARFFCMIISNRRNEPESVITVEQKNPNKQKTHPKAGLTRPKKKAKSSKQ